MIQEGIKSSIELIMVNVSTIKIYGIGYFRTFTKVFPIHVEELFKHPYIQITTSPKVSYFL